MADKPWKAFERKVAAEFNTSRQLMKGTDEKADIIHSLFEVDCKLRKAWSIPTWFRELRDSARRKNKSPVLVLRKPGKKITYAVVELSTFTSLAKAAGWLDMDAVEGDISDTEQAAGKWSHNTAASRIEVAAGAGSMGFWLP